MFKQYIGPLLHLISQNIAPWAVVSLMFTLLPLDNGFVEEGCATLNPSSGIDIRGPSWGRAAPIHPFWAPLRAV